MIASSSPWKTRGWYDSRGRRRAFEPFFTTKDVGEGTGWPLGRSRDYDLARGTIRVQSEPGQGVDSRSDFDHVAGCA
jgi:hypothetical protein